MVHKTHLLAVGKELISSQPEISRLTTPATELQPTSWGLAHSNHPSQYHLVTAPQLDSPPFSISVPTEGSSTKTTSPSAFCAYSVIPIVAISPLTSTHSWSSENFLAAG